VINKKNPQHHFSYHCVLNAEEASGAEIQMW